MCNTTLYWLVINLYITTNIRNIKHSYTDHEIHIILRVILHSHNYTPCIKQNCLSHHVCSFPQTFAKTDT